MTKEEAKEFSESAYFNYYCVTAGFVTHLREKYGETKGHDPKTKKERKRLERKWDEAERILNELS